MTIEELLIEALHKARAITDEGKQSPGKVCWFLVKALFDEIQYIKPVGDTYL